MYFGEIVEPSTRALTEDDYENYSECLQHQCEWEGTTNIPDGLGTLIFIESSKVLKIFKKSVLNDLKPICKLTNGDVNVYGKFSNLDNKEDVKYIISYECKNTDLCCGQIIEELAPWIEKSKQLVTITSASLASYQNDKGSDKFDTCVRMLSTNNGPKFNYKKLETPNLITGIGAGVLSYCINIGKDCTSFIAYMDSTPIDSVNSAALLILATQLELAPNIPNLKSEIPENNLYM